jgi:NTE family protein
MGCTFACEEERWTMKRALVLGGGGTVGVAWEMGVAAGLAEHGVNTQAADLIVGTSAGSIVGAMLAFGLDPQQLLAVQMAMAAKQPAGIQPQDPEALQAAMGKLMTATAMTPELTRELGAMALTARTMPEEAWTGYISQVLGGQTEWPERPLLLTACEVTTGDLATWDRASGVPLNLAVASSCTVPGLFPPVTIHGRQFMDGGMRSGTNADLADGHEAVLVVAPMGAEVHGIGHLCLVQEVEALRAAGVATEVVVPDRDALQAFGINFMDASLVPVAVEAGLRQGREAADRVRAVWG